MKKWILENKKNIIVMFIYMVFTFVLILMHENWRDEAQAWLIARDCSIIELISQMQYEGHFLLWYLILMPFAKLGFPYITTNIISWIIMSISVWLILKKAPFKMWKKILFIFTLPMIYLYPVISRSHCLIPLSVVLIAIFYEKRKEKPIRYICSIALLANTHILMWGMVGVLLIEFYIESFLSRKKLSKEQKKNIILSLCIIVVLLVISALPLLGCLNKNKDLGGQSESCSILNIFFNQPKDTVIRMNDFFWYREIILPVVCLSVLVFAVISLFEYPKEFVKTYISLLWPFAIFEFLYGASVQRAYFLFFIVFFFCWITIKKENKEDVGYRYKFKKIINMMIIIVLLFSIAAAYVNVERDITKSYSTAYEVGEYINNNLEEGSIIITRK